MAAILLVNRAGHILIRQHFHPASEWPTVRDVPAADIGVGESADHAAVRALWEQSRLRPDDPGILIEHTSLPAGNVTVDYFAAGTVAASDDIIADTADTLVFMPTNEIRDRNLFAGGIAGVLERFTTSLVYNRLASSEPQPYQGDAEDDERYAGWDYLGDRHVCPLTDDHRTCHRRANLLLAQGRADALHAMADAGHRCAFVRLMQFYVDNNRVADLHTLAAAGDDRAGVTLYQYLHQRHRHDLEAALSPYTATVPRLRIWQAALIGNDPSRTDEALALLAPLFDHAWYADEAQHAAYRIQVTAGRIQPSTKRKPR